MTEEEFCSRFTERVRLLVRSGRSPFGKSAEVYAERSPTLTGVSLE
jgi:hypothetical protein